jgi:hypothetical protein
LVEVSLIRGSVIGAMIDRERPLSSQDLALQTLNFEPLKRKSSGGRRDEPVSSQDVGPQPWGWVSEAGLCGIVQGQVAIIHLASCHVSRIIHLVSCHVSRIMHEQKS